MNNFLDRFFHRFGRFTVGQALILSFCLNVVLFVLLVLSILSSQQYAPGEIEQRAAELQQLRQAR